MIFDKVALSAVLPSSRCRSLRLPRASHYCDLRNSPRTAYPIAPHVTVSIGASATWPSEGGEPEGLLLAADRAMYAAKARGRNCVIAKYVG